MPAPASPDLTPGPIHSRTRLRAQQRLARSPLAGLALILICLAVYLPGQFSIPAVDRDESRFAQASRQMLEDGFLAGSTEALVVPRVQDRPRLNKPPLIYWTQALAALVFTAGDPALDAIWMYRVPSLLAAIIAALCTWRLGTRLFDARVGLLAALLLAISPIMIWESHQARADMLLLAISTASMLALQRTLTTRSLRDAIILWVLVSLGILTKGPITPMIVVLTLSAWMILHRSPRAAAGVRPLLALPIIAALCLPWVILVAQQVGWNNYLSIIFDETLGRSAAPKEGHAGPPGYHLALLPALLWPGSMLLGVALVWIWLRISSRARAARAAGNSPSQPEGARARLRRWIVGIPSRRAPELFLISWIVPSWLVFELVSTKLPHYTLPLYPALAILAARCLFACDAGVVPNLRSALVRFGLNAWLLIGAGWVVAAPLALAILGGAADSILVLITAIAAAILGILGLAATSILLYQDQFARAQTVALLTTAASLSLTLGIILPHSPTPWVSRRAADALLLADPARQHPLAAVGFHEDSLIFNTHGRIQRLADEDLANWIADHPTGIVLIPADHPGAELLGRAQSTTTGFNYSRGKPVTLEVRPASPGTDP